MGTTSEEFGTALALPATSSPTFRARIDLPTADAYQLVLYVWDYNNNRSRTVVPSIHGAPNETELPWAPRDMAVAAPYDNTINVAWTMQPGSPVSTTWSVTAQSGPTTMALTLPSDARRAQFRNVVGRRDWVVSAVGRSDLGLGTATTAAPVAVGDQTPPEPVTDARLTPSYDSQILTCTVPHDLAVTTRSAREYLQPAARPRRRFRQRPQCEGR